MSVGRIIEGPGCIAEGVDWLRRTDAGMARAVELLDEVPLRLRAEGFSELLGMIVSQQVSVASASAIWARLEAAEMVTPDRVCAASEDDLRALGLSRPKARYAKALAEAGIDFEGLRALPDAQVVARLTQVPGIGVWTAEIYAMFSLGRADVFAPGDLALQEAARILYGLDERPKESAFRELAEAWSPWRAVAARILWAYYRVAKSREGIR